jgi:hypothetical protein
MLVSTVMTMVIALAAVTPPGRRGAGWLGHWLDAAGYEGVVDAGQVEPVGWPPEP